MSLGTVTTVAALSAAAAFMLASSATEPAAAADMPALYSPTAPYVEDGAPSGVGTGWYLRGDAAFTLDDRPKLSLQNNEPTFDTKGTQFGYAFGGGVGYQLTRWLRADITGDYLDPFHYTVNIPCGYNCAINQRANIERWDGLVNGYFDLGTFAGLTPYIGAGIGVAGTNERGSIGVNGSALASGIIDPRTGTLVTSKVPSHTAYEFAWAATAGVSYAFAPNFLVDANYRYLNLGRTTITLFPSHAVTHDLSSQQVRVGLRYMID